MTNAFQAVRAASDQWVRVTGERRGAELILIVEDSGAGIPVEHRERIFEPFFTTHAFGDGAGLGLSYALGVARDHDGDVVLDTVAPHTRFVISVPAALSKWVIGALHSAS